MPVWRRASDERGADKKDAVLFYGKMRIAVVEAKDAAAAFDAGVLLC